MLKYKIDVLEELKGKGYTSYKLRKDKIMGEAQIQKSVKARLPAKKHLILSVSCCRYSRVICWNMLMINHSINALI